MTLDADKTSIRADRSTIDGNSAGSQASFPQARHRLGRWINFVPLQQRVVGRLYAAGVAAAAGIVLGLAAGLAPGTRDLGTHRQLGLPPCGFVTVTGLPCPTCGMTTAFAHTVRGQFGAAIRCQAAGFLSAIATACAGVVATLAVLTGRRPAVNWYRVNPTRFVWWLVGLLVASWAVKIVLGLMDGSLPAR